MSVSPVQTVIEGFWIKNYKGLKQVAFGSSFQQTLVTDLGQESVPYELSSLTTFIGPSGTGKSTILDVFTFLADCINHGLDDAFARRGGFDTVYTRGGEGPISIGLVYRACAEPRPLTYALNIGRRKGSGSGYVETEAIVYRGTHHGAVAQPILFFQNGEKTTRHLTPWHGATTPMMEGIKRIDQRTLALPLLAEHEDIPDVPQLKLHLDRFHLACYTPDNALGLTPPLLKLPKGSRLALELKRMEEKHRFELPGILEIIAKRMPGIEKINYEKTESGRAVLSFLYSGQEEPFHAHQVSEGTLRLFTHLLLFEDPMPTPLIGIEEPNAYMDEDQIRLFANFACGHVQEMGGSQFFLTTHQSTLVDFMDPTDVWILGWDDFGNTRAFRALDELAFHGIDPNAIGPYWFSKYAFEVNAGRS